LLKLTNYFGERTINDSSVNRGFKYTKDKVVVSSHVDLGVGIKITDTNFLEQLDTKAKDLYKFKLGVSEYVFSLKELEGKLDVTRKG